MELLLLWNLQVARNLVPFHAHNICDTTSKRSNLDVEANWSWNTHALYPHVGPGTWILPHHCRCQFHATLIGPSFLLCNWEESIWATSSVHVGMNYSTSTCIALTGVPILVSHFQGRGAPCHLPLRWLVRNSCLRILHRDSKTWRGRTNALTPSRRLRLDCLFYLESCDVTSNGRKTGEMGKICRLRSSIGWRFRQAEFGRLTTPTDDRPSVRPSSEVRKRKGGGDGSKP